MTDASDDGAAGANRDLADATRAVQLLKDVAEASNHATELASVLSYSIGRICKSGGWELGHCWLIDGNDGARSLTESAIWHVEGPDTFADFRRATGGLDVSVAGAMPRRAAEAGRPVWVESVDQDEDFIRAGVAAEAGLRSAVAVPIMVGDEVVAVMEFFSRRMRPQDPWDLLGHVGVILGRVAERVRAQSRQERHEHRFRQVIQTAHDAFVAMDDGGAIEEWSARAEELFGWQRAEVIGRPLAEVLLPERYRAAHTAGLARYLETGEARVLNRPIELEAVHRDGHEIPVELTISRLETETGVLFCSFLRSIKDRLVATEHRRQLELERVARAHAEALEMEVRRSEERYRFLANSIPQQAWQVGASGQLVYMNDVGLEYFGVESVDERSDWHSVVHREDRESAASTWRSALVERKTYQARMRLRRRDGQHRWHLVLARPDLAGDGSIVGWYGTCTDLDDQLAAEAARDRALERLAKANVELKQERRRLERQKRELSETAEALERSNRELDQFAYVASHDLRAPLRGIANLTRFLQEDLAEVLTDDTGELLELLRSRVHRMESLIDGILAYSRATRSAVDDEEVATGPMVRELIDMLGLDSSFEVVIDPDLPVIRTPRTALERVLLNLLSNAARYAGESPSPRVEVGARPTGHFWEFWVKDNGPGIAPEYHDRIWGVFQTLANADEKGGTGIGLAIVQKIAEHHGGRAWLQSEPGAGATFFVSWPSAGEEDG